MSKIQLIAVEKPQGIHFHFDNGMIASVQFGAHHYCHHLKEEIKDIVIASASSVEIACWCRPSLRARTIDYLIEYDTSQTQNYKGWVSIEEIPKFLEWCKNYKF